LVPEAVGVPWVGLVGGAVYGAITGFVLVLLLRRPVLQSGERVA